MFYWLQKKKIDKLDKIYINRRRRVIGNSLEFKI